MKSADRDSPRRVSGPERTDPKVDRPRAIDQYIAYFGDRTTTRSRTAPSRDQPSPLSPVRRAPH